MKCTFCGEELPVGAKYCPNCGTEVELKQTDQIIEPDCQNENIPDVRENLYEENSYSYGQIDDSAKTPKSSQEGAGSIYEYGQSVQNQKNEYNQMNYNQGYSEKNISGTPYLVFSILTTLCCCLPLGIAAIIYSCRINSLNNQGDYAGACAAAKKAKLLCIVGAVGGLIASVGLGVAGTMNTLDEFDYRDEFTTDDLVKENDDIDDVDSTYEFVEGSWNEFSVTIDGKTLQLPCSVGEVEAIGLDLDDEEDVDNKVVNAGDYELVFYESDSDDYLMFMMCNDTQSSIKVLECAVKGVYLADYNVENGLSVVFPGDVQIGSDIDEVIEKWGEPSDSYEGDETDSYSWYDDSYNYCTVSVNHETGKIESVDLDGSGL